MNIHLDARSSDCGRCAVADKPLGTKTRIVHCHGTAVYFKLTVLSNGERRWLRYEKPQGMARFKETSSIYPVGRLVEAIRNHEKLGAIEPTVPDDYESDTVSKYAANLQPKTLRQLRW